jgi:predicted nucleic acid-binding protein
LVAIPNTIGFSNSSSFVDAAIAGNADYIVTEDHHLHILKSIEFPVVNILNIQEFKDMTLS